MKQRYMTEQLWNVSYLKCGNNTSNPKNYIDQFHGQKEIKREVSCHLFPFLVCINYTMIHCEYLPNNAKLPSH